MKSTKLLATVWAIGVLSVLAVLYANNNLSIRCQLICPSYIHHSGTSITFRLPRTDNVSQAKTLTLLYPGGAINLNSNKSGMFGLKSPESPGIYQANMSYDGVNLFSISFAYLGGLEYIPYILVGISIFMSITSISEYLSSLSDFELYVGDSVYFNPTPYSSNAIEVGRAIDTIRKSKSSKYKKIEFSEILFMMRGMHDFGVSPSKEIVAYMLCSAEDKRVCDNSSIPASFNYGKLCYDVAESYHATNFSRIPRSKMKKRSKHFPKHRFLPLKAISMMNEGDVDAWTK